MARVGQLGRVGKVRYYYLKITKKVLHPQHPLAYPVNLKYNTVS